LAATQYGGVGAHAAAIAADARGARKYDRNLLIHGGVSELSEMHGHGQIETQLLLEYFAVVLDTQSSVEKRSRSVDKVIDSSDKRRRDARISRYAPLMIIVAPSHPISDDQSPR
jgi:hypothetical protein